MKSCTIEIRFVQVPGEELLVEHDSPESGRRSAQLYNFFQTQYLTLNLENVPDWAACGIVHFQRMVTI